MSATMTFDEVDAVLKVVTTPVLLYGPPCTGKTHMAQTPECYAITLTPDTAAAEIRGHYVPKGTEFVWRDGPGIKAYARDGRRLVLNELHNASGDVIALTYVLADDPSVSRITLPTSETVSPVDGYSIVGTTNGSPEELPEAIRSRFSIQLPINEINPAVFLMIGTRYRSTAVASVSGHANMKTDIRQWFAFERLAQQVPEELAARAVFQHNAREIMTAVALANVKNKK